MPLFSEDAELWLELGVPYIEGDETPAVVLEPLRLPSTLEPLRFQPVIRPLFLVDVLQPELADG